MEIIQQLISSSTLTAVGLANLTIPVDRFYCTDCDNAHGDDWEDELIVIIIIILVIGDCN